MTVRSKSSAVVACLLAITACGCNAAADIGIEAPKSPPLDVAVIVGCTGSEAKMRAPGQLFEKAVMEVARRTAEQEGTFSFTCVGRNPDGEARFPVDNTPFSTRWNTPKRRRSDLDGQAEDLRPKVVAALPRTAKLAGSRIDQMVKLGADQVRGGAGRRVVVVVSDGMSTDGRPGRFHAYRHPAMTIAQVTSAVRTLKQAGELPDLTTGGRPIEVYFLGVRDGRNVLEPEGTAAVHTFLTELVNASGGVLQALSPGIDLRGFGGSAAAAPTTKNEG